MTSPVSDLSSKSYSAAGGRDAVRTPGAGGTRWARPPATARSPTPTETPGRNAQLVSQTQSRSNYTMIIILSGL